MKKTLCVSVWFLLIAASLHAADDDFAGRLRKAQAAHDAAQSASILEDWKAARPSDPEYYIAAANDLLDHAPQAGSAADDSASPEQQAVDLLKEGVARAPERMDLYLGLALIYEHTDDSAALLADLTDMATYANAHSGRVYGRGGKPYPTPVDQNLSRQIDSIATRYYARETDAGYQTFHDLARLEIEAFSNCEYGYNLMGVYYSMVKDDAKLALANYEHAVKLAPRDSSAWINVGLVHKQAGEKQPAVTAFLKVVELNNDPDCVRQAKAQLAKLNVKTK